MLARRSGSLAAQATHAVWRFEQRHVRPAASPPQIPTNHVGVWLPARVPLPHAPQSHPNPADPLPTPTRAANVAARHCRRAHARPLVHRPRQGPRRPWPVGPSRSLDLGSLHSTHAQTSTSGVAKRPPDVCAAACRQTPRAGRSASSHAHNCCSPPLLRALRVGRRTLRRSACRSARCSCMQQQCSSRLQLRHGGAAAVDSAGTSVAAAVPMLSSRTARVASERSGARQAPDRCVDRAGAIESSSGLQDSIR